MQSAIILQIVLVYISFYYYIKILDAATNSTADKNLQKITFNESLRKTPASKSGKWQVGRVSRKQYEVINMLWRKTKIFIDQDTSTKKGKPVETDKTTKSLNYKNSPKYEKRISTKLKAQNPISIFLTSSKVKIKPSTPSYMEFYYLDESDDRIYNKDKLRLQNTEESKIAFLRSPFFLFRVNDATCRKTLQNAFTPSLQNSNNKSKFGSISTSNKIRSKNLPLNITKRQASNISFITNTVSTKKHTTPFDRIKFFEIYDRDTYTPHTLQSLQNKRMIDNGYISFEEKTYIDHDDENSDKTRFIKKHFDISLESQEVENKDKQTILTTKIVQSQLKISLYQSQPAKWSDYPFVAVYVYEPEQVRCDCASISPHWLVSAATCLYRYRKEFRAESTSAFVVYCTDNWRKGRIAYVSKTLIHPEFHASDRNRRQLYNIGAIQVVNSMSNTCYGWQPVNLMSHEFATDRRGTIATAIGWGLDRYDTKFSTSELPRHPLMMYESLAYSDSCPGNIGYSKAKRLNEECVKNVYCLSLPPYIIEENDTVHGGLLLVAGKLTALYSQEERRSWGEQSAQYTVIWHLIPWLNDVARELDEPDTFDSDI